MSRGNVFKLSGNMALGGGADYPNNDMEQIKNSLKLLKQKKNQRQSLQDQYNKNYGNSGNSYSSKNTLASKNDYNYESAAKNNLPMSQKDTGSDFGKKGYGNDYRQGGRQNDPYDYSNKPPSYPQQNNTRNNRNVVQSVHQPQSYENYPSYSKNAGGKSSTAQTKSSDYDNGYKPQQRAVQQKVQTSQKQYYNDKQQRSIKQVNRENQVDIVEYDPSELRPCRICERKFNPDSLAKHQMNCKKVFQSKRKQFNAQEHRIVDNQQKKLMKKGQQAQKKIEAQQKNQKIPKWKAESLAFRAVLKQTRNDDVDPKEAAMIQQIQNQTGVKCPHCGRKFNQNAGPRHIKFCEQQAKKNQMKKKK